MILIFLLLPLLAISSDFLAFNTLHQLNTTEPSQSHTFNLTGTKPQTLILNVEPVSGRLRIYYKFLETSDVEGKEVWTVASADDKELSLNRQFVGCGTLENSQYLSVTVMNPKYESVIPMKYNLMAAYQIQSLSVGDQLQTTVGNNTFFLGTIAQCIDQTAYITFSGIASDKSKEMFNFFVTKAYDLIPREERSDFASIYGNHIQLQSAKGKCLEGYNLAIWSESEEPVDVEIKVASFSIRDQHRVIPAGSMYIDYSQHSDSQTYIFFNWSADQMIRIKWRSHGRARLFLDNASSEEEAKSITQVQGRSAAQSYQNTGGDIEVVIALGEQLYCGHCFYVMEILKEEGDTLLYSIMITHGYTIEEIRLNEPIRRQIKSGKQRFLFQTLIDTDYKITVTNNANDVDFGVILDCRSESDISGQFRLPIAYGHSESIIFSPPSKVGDYFCLMIKVADQYKYLDTYIEVSSMHTGYSLLINGHESQVHFSLEHDEELRYFALPLGKGDHIKDEQTDVDLYLHQKKGSENMFVDFCVKVEGGFTDLEGLNSEIELDQVEYLEKQENWAWCSDKTLWKPLKFIIDSSKLAAFKNAGLLVKLRVGYEAKANYNSLQFELLASYNGIINLTPHADYANQLTKSEDAYDLYHLHIPEGLYAEVRIMPCYGAVLLEVFESVKDLRHGTQYHRESTSETGDIRYQHSGKEGQDQIYLKVLYFDKWSESTYYAEYRLRLMLTKEENPRPAYFAENLGQITWKNKKDSIQLSWGPLKQIEIEGEEPVIASNVYYSVYFSSSLNLDMRSSCALHDYGMLRVTDLTELKYDAHRPRRYRRDEREITYQVNVLATVSDIRETYPYKRTSITFSKAMDDSESHAYIYVIAFVLVLLFGVGIAFLLLMIRYKKTQERLYYEMQDVRNIAGIELTELSSHDDSDHQTPLEVDKEE